jgi:hypothetical protein
MTAIVYPASLPGPVRQPRRAAERRALSTGPGPLQARSRSRDWLADHELEFVFTPAEMAEFLAWWEDPLQHGGAWFAAHAWPSADPAVGGVYQFQGGVRTVHRGLGVQRVQATAQERGRGVDPHLPEVYEIELDCEANAGGSSSVGILVNVLDASSTYRLTLTAGGWSRHDLDSDNGGLAWFNDFMVTHGGGDVSIGSAASGYATSAAAYAAYVPQTVTGYTAYTFWLFDDNLGDNRAGLTVRIERVA